MPCATTSCSSRAIRARSSATASRRASSPTRRTTRPATTGSTTAGKPPKYSPTTSERIAADATLTAKPTTATAITVFLSAT